MTTQRPDSYPTYLAPSRTTRKAVSVPTNRTRRRLTSLGVLMATIATSLFGVALAAPQAAADTAPATGTPATVSADALPTIQINGVVWSQVTVGNTVYAVGEFSTVRPAGVAAGGAGEISAGNIVAYDIRTGNRITTFNHTLNAQGMAVAASPDGSRIYVGGDFTSVDGQVRNHIAAFDTATGALISTFAPSISSRVRALAVTPTAVYAGGEFPVANNTPRKRVAAFNPSNGVLLPWNPSADDGYVWALAALPDRNKVIIGGQMQHLSGATVNGMAAVDMTSGAVLPWAANQTLQDYNNGAIDALRYDGQQVYGAGYAFGAGGTFEGTFALNPDTGAINLANDCHGDTYDVFPVGQVLYSVSHVHGCDYQGGFPSSNPWSINQHHSLAQTTYPVGVNTGPDDYGWNYSGIPASTNLHWWPDFIWGTYTPYGQATWSLSGNTEYLAVGGEFRGVNGVFQQGLARFAVTAKATNKQGPIVNSATPAMTARSQIAGSIRLSWQALADRDNTTLTYKLYRSGKADPVYTATQDSVFWNKPTMGFIDSGLTPGASYTYTLRVTDPFGNQATRTAGPTTVSSTALSAYGKDVIDDGAQGYWRLGDSGTAVADGAGFADMNLTTGATRGVAGAISGDADQATRFSGDNNFAATQSPVPGPDVFTLEAWISTTSTSGGKIAGFGNANTGNSSSYDRHLYMDPSGTVYFGVYNNASYVVASATPINDGSWHHLVGTLDGTGMSFFVDGKRVGRNTGTTMGQPYSGYWRIGGDSTWAGSNYFAGVIDEVALYPTALSATQVQEHYTDSGRALDLPPVPTDSYGAAVYQDGPESYWRMNETTGTTTVDSSRNGNDASVFGGTTLGATGPLGGGDRAFIVNGSDGVVSGVNAVANPSQYSEELWFKTTTTSGGKIIGFGDQRNGLSGNYDRHVYMLDSGQLLFGTWTGEANTITSQRTYNDGSWHHLVASQGAAGMNLYVDGVSVGTHPQTGAQPYNGYWRVGGDRTWGGTSSYFFNGTIDEVAIYAKALTPTQVVNHFTAGGGQLPNQPPTAGLTVTAQGLKVTADGTTSNDPDGDVASYSWDFGDQTASVTGSKPNHTYTAAGTYTVTLTVTDDDGATASATKSITLNNTAPEAAFTSAPDALEVSFDGSDSVDADGTIAAYSWDFGDTSAPGSGATPTHTYTAAGTYTVELTVTDNAGGTGTVSHDITVTTVNVNPTAAFSSTVDGLTVSADGSASVDTDGTIATYAWDFGDSSATQSGVKPEHTYTAGGTYTVKLTVTDDRNGTDSVTHTVTVTAPNQKPTPAFTSSSSGLTASFDATGSADPDGTIASYAWDFGDNTAAGSGSKPNHAYGSAGSYSVKLTVTDNSGATDSLTKSVTVSAVPTTLAADTFDRTSTRGWGAADTGGSWSYGDSITRYTVSGGVGKITVVSAGSAPSAVLGSVSGTSTDAQVEMSLDARPSAGSTNLWLIARGNASNGYRERVTVNSAGVVTLAITRWVNGAETVIVSQTVAGMTYSPGDTLMLRMQAQGVSPTTLKAKVWKKGATEPASWQLSTSDATSSLQAAGAVGVQIYMSGTATNLPIVLSVNNLSVGRLP